MLVTLNGWIQMVKTELFPSENKDSLLLTLIANMKRDHGKLMMWRLLQSSLLNKVTRLFKWHQVPPLDNNGTLSDQRKEVRLNYKYKTWIKYLRFLILKTQKIWFWRLQLKAHNQKELKFQEKIPQLLQSHLISKLKIKRKMPNYCISSCKNKSQDGVDYSKRQLC